MVMKPVNSSNVDSVGYDNGKMHVRFNSGYTYAYSNVPESVYREFVSSASVGRYHHQHISRRYGETRIS